MSDYEKIMIVLMTLGVGAAAASAAALVYIAKSFAGDAEPGPGEPVLPPYGSLLVLDERWDGIDTSRWKVEHSNYGGWGQPGNRLQHFRPENVEVVAAPPGGEGTILRLTAKREEYKGAPFTGGMISSRDTGTFYPRYGLYEFRARLPHGQGIWPAFWLRHRDGASICEPDVMEYFHAQNGGRTSSAVHRTDDSGKFKTNLLGGSADFETPTLVDAERGWHVFQMHILPWTASTVVDGTLGDPSRPSRNVRFVSLVDGRVVLDGVDSSAMNWSQRYADDAFDVCLQGSQIGGDWAGHPDDALGYSRWRNACLSRAGSPPDACATSVKGSPIIRGEFPNSVDLDWVRVWKLMS